MLPIAQDCIKHQRHSVQTLLANIRVSRIKKLQYQGKVFMHRILNGIRWASLLVMVLWSASANAAIPASERAVLTDLYASTNGASSWTIKTNWNGATGTECTWYGVTCDATQSHVIGISLDSNRLSGILSSLNALTFLQSFSANNNSLLGSSIPSLSGLTSLQNFSAYNCGLKGSIPSLSGLTSLRTFDVSQNLTTGSIPSLSGLTSLQTFNVSRTNISGCSNFPVGKGVRYRAGLAKESSDGKQRFVPVSAGSEHPMDGRAG